MASKVNFLLVEHLSVEIKQSGGLDGWNRHHFSVERGPSGAGNQGCQYRTGGRTGLATGTIYFGYRSIPMYRFGFTAIFYIYK